MLNAVLSQALLKHESNLRPTRGLPKQISKRELAYSRGGVLAPGGSVICAIFVQPTLSFEAKWIRDLQRGRSSQCQNALQSNIPSVYSVWQAAVVFRSQHQNKEPFSKTPTVFSLLEIRVRSIDLF